MIREKLKDNILSVTFTKADGSKRVMICTLMENIIPSVSGNSKPKEGVVTVWDIEADAWRSFKEDSVIEVKILQPDGEFS